MTGIERMSMSLAQNTRSAPSKREQELEKALEKERLENILRILPFLRFFPSFLITLLFFLDLYS